MSRFEAPWSVGLKVMSFAMTALLVGVAGVIAVKTSSPAIVALPVGLLVGSALFTIRGYELRGKELLVLRLIWTTRFDLQSLEAVWASPSAMARSWRVFGNGGLFSISGLYRNKRLGTYRALATDASHAVVLELPKRAVVITPAVPQLLIDALGKRGFEAAVEAGRNREA